MQIGGVNQSHSQVFLTDIWCCHFFALNHSDVLSDLSPATRSSLGMALPRLHPLYTQTEQNIYPIQLFENSPRLIFYQAYYPYATLWICCSLFPTLLVSLFCILICFRGARDTFNCVLHLLLCSTFFFFFYVAVFHSFRLVVLSSLSWTFHLFIHFRFRRLLFRIYQTHFIPTVDLCNICHMCPPVHG